MNDIPHPSSTPRAAVAKPKIYRVIAGDNFHPFDENESDRVGGYSSYADAVQAAMRAVEKSLRWERDQSRDPRDPEELLDRYLDFGDSAVIRPDITPPVLCNRLCQSGGGSDLRGTTMNTGAFSAR